MSRHRVFISYHHLNDQQYKNQLEGIFRSSYEVALSNSVQIGDLNPNLPSDRLRQLIRDKYIRDATVTIVLIGTETWKRRHVDWEIGSSIRKTEYNSRCGLIGLLLPTRSDYYRDSFYPYTIPPRLYLNAKNGYAKIYNWTTNFMNLKYWIDEAFDRRNVIIPDNSFPNFVNNRSGDRWYE
ncbi:TIR domain-containing protein [Sediminispirochaeta smaragdinae]|uniref:Thoeris protein ThsB TIR-like domain-containing protein n=1 Tax=Sediminispirochaeta smaragdinae (strain DSM 11293 / JCM 15392 / SEBR 4228) TaxID=573413 RepID=E1RB18_SEDSS|nr:TIR domain-containing protein [Sediminispirochaeta smaragdinae]ADK79548.1 Domain of unknown function DUF1863 [Sediminispirochaeta smaragdinae DSM 11293]